MNSLALFLLLFAFMFLGMPISIALGLSSLLTIMLFAQDSLASLAIKLFETSEHYTLMAIPYFILGGALMSTGGVAKRLIRFAVACVGHVRGGLAIAAVLACTFFAAVSGSSPATVVAIGSIMIAGMIRQGYTQKFAAGVMANAGTLGILMPPSIVMVVYAAVTELSVGRMFMAGVVPGHMLATMLGLAVFMTWRHWLGTLDKLGNGEQTFILRLPLGWSYATGLLGGVAFVIVAAYCVVRSGASLASRHPRLPRSGVVE